MFEIEKDVPVPTKTKRGYSKYPFASMEVGESFLIVDPSTQNKVKAAAYNWAHRYPEYKFCVRVTDKGMRVWRVPV